MTQIRFELREGDFSTPSTGFVHIAPVHRVHVDGTEDYFALSDYVAYALVDGKVTIEMMPSASDWAWMVFEEVDGGEVRCVTVPDSPTPLDYGDLTQVDPTTFDPYEPFTTVGEQLATKITGIGIAYAQVMTQAAYDALPIKNPTTLYVIRG